MSGVVMAFVIVIVMAFGIYPSHEDLKTIYSDMYTEKLLPSHRGNQIFNFAALQARKQVQRQLD